MVVKYYKSSDLKYTSRKRHQTFNFEPFAEEEQNAVLLGDGATTTIKTNAEHICDYVTIDDTRWFVLYYTYMNGGQVTLYLQRDVIGENGVDGCFGKIERGYTNSFLKNRKELSLNQILKKRTPLKPNTNSYGNFSVDNHNDELWGVLYLAKPTELDPNTGQPYPNQININIPAFSPKVVDYDFIENNTEKTYKASTANGFTFTIKYAASVFSAYNEKNFRISITFLDNGNNDISVHEVTDTDYSIRVKTQKLSGETVSINNYEDLKSVMYDIGNKVALHIRAIQNTSNPVFKLAEYFLVNDTEYGKYNGVTLKHGEEFCEYAVSKVTRNTYGKIGEKNDLLNMLSVAIGNKTSTPLGDGVYYSVLDTSISGFLTSTAHATAYNNLYTYRVLTPNEAGALVIDVSEQLVDEPFSILVFPLYGVNISGSKNYSINKSIAFMIFNTVIQYLSGENPYLVDAQIYPYCPELINVSSEIKGYPFFSINSTSFITTSEVQLLPYSNIKKEYIERQYSIVSPEQSGNFAFNFYDYKNIINDINGINYEKIEIIIKTALKPFSIIASAVIIPDVDALKGITYDSDLRGCQPSSNGFECSLSSNLFQQYKRQNSNYQQIFSLQQNELNEQHKVERANENASKIVNTLSATMMGTIGGASLGSGPISRAIGGGIGGAAAGLIVGGAMQAQYEANEKLRKYEVSLQQQSFDLEIGTIKNLPNSVNRISSFNEVILKNFYFCIETYECSETEKEIVDNFINYYGYAIGVFGLYNNFIKNGWFLRGSLTKSNYHANLHTIAESELKGGIYLYD